jgi:hypothetical protein
VKLIPLKSGDEVDGLSRQAKRFHKWRAGVRRAIKRRFNKRVRKINIGGEGKDALRIGVQL